MARERTAYFALVTVILETVIPLLVATLLNSGICGSIAFRTIYFLLVVISLALADMRWSIIYDLTFSGLNTVPNDLGGLTRFWL